MAARSSIDGVRDRLAVGAPEGIRLARPERWEALRWCPSFFEANCRSNPRWPAWRRVVGVERPVKPNGLATHSAKIRAPEKISEVVRARSVGDLMAGAAFRISLDNDQPPGPECAQPDLKGGTLDGGS